MGNAVHGARGKATRLLILAGVGLVPVAGPLAGLAAGALDAFVLDEVLSANGPAAFLSDLPPGVPVSDVFPQ
jgi:hypothetical protein